MFKLIQQPRGIRFRRFCHKAYAAFCSLHREVTIGRIAGYMTDLEMLKQGKSIAVSALLLCSGIAAAETDEGAPPDSAALTAQQLSLQEVLVVAQKAEVHSEAYRLITQVSHAEIEALSIQTVADILQYLPGIDVRTRGANGAQADISMRGGTFDQVLVMLNGVSLSDFHTGHYALNIPISTELIERIEVLQGTSASLHGAFSGAVNIVTKSKVESPTSKDVTLKLTAGMNGLVNPEVAASIQPSKQRSDKLLNGEQQLTFNLSAEYSRADGYYAPSPTEKEATACRNSDFKLANLYFQTRWRGLDVQAGAQWKDAGLGMGYGFGSQDQFDATRTAFASAGYEHRWGAWRLDAQAAYRANYDRYEWHRGQRLYGNFHFAQTASAAIAAHYASRIGTTSFGVSARNENMHSTNLGDTIHPDGQVPNVADFPLSEVRVLDLVRGGNRFHANYYAEQTFYYAGLSASIGINGTYNTQFGHHVGGGANIGYAFQKGGTVYVNANRSLRMPTFTDLYYNAGNQLGNSNLRPEEAWLLSVGYKGEWRMADGEKSAGTLSVAADWYYRWGRNIIDWVYVAEDAKRPYHAMNQQQVNATGVEVSVAYRLNEWLRCLSVDYAYTYLDLNLKESGSRYLDYLSHKLAIHLEHGIYKGFGASWTVRWQKREGQYNNAEGAVHDYTPVWLLDGSVYWQNRFLRVSADCTNMTNTRYYDYGGILQPGAWAKVTIKAML
ncbi:MAG: TonB-dependent receptor plug domain-containing protein [Paludibacteraceae bacterium]|nr:TonB-dependent receptor plug domain-containing protein [Paludibacteraceae bacterium]